jgi:hypothetical protein
MINIPINMKHEHGHLSTPYSFRLFRATGAWIFVQYTFYYDPRTENLFFSLVGCNIFRFRHLCTLLSLFDISPLGIHFFAVFFIFEK